MQLTLRSTQQKRGGRAGFLLGMTVMAALLCISAQGFAMDFTTANGVSVNLDTHLSWQGAWRMENQDKAILANANGDDGDRNFDKYDWVNNLYTATMDLEIKYRNAGLFVRPRAYYDFAYEGTNANDSPMTNNNLNIYGGPLSATNEFAPKTLDRHRDKMEILDAYVYNSFTLNNQSVDVRAGRQVINWGQALYTLSGLAGSQNPIDATKSNVPGTELRDLYLPQGSLYANVGLLDNLSIAGYYGFEHEPSRLDEAGSYFSTGDYLLEAGQNFLIGTPFGVERRAYEDPSETGQYGMALSYNAGWLNEAEFGAYFINYHAKFPMLHVNPGSGGTLSGPGTGGSWGNGTLDYLDSSSYDILYNQNIKMYALAMNTMVGNASVGMEVNYRRDIGVTVTDGNFLGIQNYVGADVFSSIANVSYLAGPTFLWDQLTLVGEVGQIRIFDLADKELSGTDEFAWGGTANATFAYNRPFPSLYMNVSFPISYSFNVSGVSPLAGGFSEDNDSMSFKADFDFYDRIRVGVGYTEFLHDGKDNPKADRDMVSTYIKYSF